MLEWDGGGTNATDADAELLILLGEEVEGLVGISVVVLVELIADGEESDAGGFCSIGGGGTKR